MPIDVNIEDMLESELEEYDEEDMRRAHEFLMWTLTAFIQH